MKLKNIVKILIVFMLLIMISNIVFAENLTDPKQFDSSGELTLPVGGTAESLIVRALGVLLTLLRTVTLGWAIIMCFAIAVKYMLAKPAMKTQLKLDMPTYIIGAVLLFGASGLMTLLQFFVDDVFVSE